MRKTNTAIKKNTKKTASKSTNIMADVDTTTRLMFSRWLSELVENDLCLRSLDSLAACNNITPAQMICGLLESYMVRNHSWSLGLNSYEPDHEYEYKVRSNALDLLDGFYNISFCVLPTIHTSVSVYHTMSGTKEFSSSRKVVTLLKHLADAYMKELRRLLDNDAAHTTIKNLYNLSVNLYMGRGAKSK